MGKRGDAKRERKRAAMERERAAMERERETEKKKEKERAKPTWSQTWRRLERELGRQPKLVKLITSVCTVCGGGFGLMRYLNSHNELIQHVTDLEAHTFEYHCAILDQMKANHATVISHLSDNKDMLTRVGLATRLMHRPPSSPFQPHISEMNRQIARHRQIMGLQR